MIRSYNERKLRHLQVKKNCLLSLILPSFQFSPPYCVPSDNFVKEELMIANYYIIKW